MFNNVDFRLIRADRICDRVPVVSSVSNLVDLVQKALVIPSNKKSAGLGAYFTHLDRKHAARCAILMIPVIGNIIVALFDFASRQKKANLLPLGIVNLETGKVNLENDQSPAGQAFRMLNKKNEEQERLIGICMNAIRSKVTTEITSVEDAIKVVGKDGMKLQELPENFKKNEEVVLAAVQNNGLAIQHADEQCKTKYKIALAAVGNTAKALQFISECECYDEKGHNRIIYVLNAAYLQNPNVFEEIAAKKFSEELIENAKKLNRKILVTI